VRLRELSRASRSRMRTTERPFFFPSAQLLRQLVDDIKEENKILKRGERERALRGHAPLSARIKLETLQLEQVKGGTVLLMFPHIRQTALRYATPYSVVRLLRKSPDDGLRRWVAPTNGRPMNWLGRAYPGCALIDPQLGLYHEHTLGRHTIALSSARGLMNGSGDGPFNLFTDDVHRTSCTLRGLMNGSGDGPFNLPCTAMPLCTQSAPRRTRDSDHDLSTFSERPDSLWMTRGPLNLWNVGHVGKMGVISHCTSL